MKNKFKRFLQFQVLSFKALFTREEFIVLGNVQRSTSRVEIK